MKIAFVFSSCENVGPFIVARDIINNIYTETKGIDIYYIKDSAEKLHYEATLHKVGLFEKTDFSKYDIVHSHGFLGDVYAWLNRKSVKGKRISTLHQEIKPDYTLQYNWLIGTVLEKFWCFVVNKNDCVVTLTQQMANYYKDKIKCNTIFIYNGTSPVVHENAIPAAEDEQIRVFKSKYGVLGVSARITFRKGIDLIIRALALPGGCNLGLLVLGDGEKKEELLALAKKLQVEDRCLFLGYKSNAIDYYKYFDVYMMASRSEAFGLCVIEAASQKIPLVCSNLPVFSELFNDDEVVRFKCEDVAALCNAANGALKNAAQLSEKVYNRYVNSYTAEKMAQNYLRTYKQLIN